MRCAQDNVEAFGGSSSNVTVLGHAAGGIAVAHLAACTEANTLFSRAVLMSAAPETIPKQQVQHFHPLRLPAEL